MAKGLKKRAEDRFGIYNCNSVKELKSMNKLHCKSFTLNEHISFIHHYNSLSKDKMDKRRNYLSNNIFLVSNYLSQIIDEEPMLGRLSYTLAELNYRNTELNAKLSDLIISEVLENESDEILFGLAGFDRIQANFSAIWQKELFRQAFETFENMVKKHVSMKSYDTKKLNYLLEILIKNGCSDIELYEEIQFQIEKKFDNEKEEETLTTEELIKCCFNLSSLTLDCHNIFSVLNSRLEKELNELGWKNGEFLDGKLLAFYCFSWRIQQQMTPSLIMTSEEKEKLVKLIYLPSSRFSLQELVYIHESMEVLGIGGNLTIDFINCLEKKLFSLNSETTKVYLEDVHDYIKIRISMDESRNNLSQAFKKLDELCAHHILEFEENSLYQFCLQIEEMELFHFFKRFLNAIPTLIVQNLSHYDFEVLCYFYLILLEHCNESESAGLFWSQMNTIKETIKFVAFRRGFKIEIGSNFYKLLNKVDANEMFQGGDVGM